MYTSNRLRILQQLVVVAIVITLAALVYLILTSLHIRHTTGILNVTTSNKNAVITVSKTNSSAEIIGTGEAHVRLQKSSYLIVATQGGNQATTTVRIAIGKTSTIRLNLVNTTSVLPPQPSFNGFDTLVDRGLSFEQEMNLEQLLLTYKPSAETFKIDTSTITSDTRYPSITDPSLGLLFNLVIDGVPFKASVLYSGLEHITLTLSSPQTGTQLYTSTSAS